MLLVLKSRDITLLAKVCIVNAMVFPVVTYGCQSWTVKVEHQRIDAFELWCWRRLQRIHWTVRISSQSILREINHKFAEAETPVFWSSDMNSWLIGKVSDSGKDLGRKRRGYQRMRWLNDITNAMDMNLGELQEMVRDRETCVLQSMGSQRVREDWAIEQQVAIDICTYLDWTWDWVPKLFLVRLSMKKMFLQNSDIF